MSGKGAISQSQRSIGPGTVLFLLPEINVSGIRAISFSQRSMCPGTELFLLARFPCKRAILLNREFFLHVRELFLYVRELFLSQ